MIIDSDNIDVNNMTEDELYHLQREISNIQYNIKTRLDKIEEINEQNEIERRKAFLISKGYSDFDGCDQCAEPDCMLTCYGCDHDI